MPGSRGKEGKQEGICEADMLLLVIAGFAK